MKIRNTAFIVLLASLLLTACGSASDQMSSAAESEKSFKPTLDVKFEISGDDVTVRFVTDLIISEEHVGQARKSGEGHIHMYLDDGEKERVLKEETVLPDLSPGEHKLRISLHNNDHTPYDVTLTKTFNIK